MTKDKRSDVETYAALRNDKPVWLWLICLGFGLIPVFIEIGMIKIGLKKLK